MLFAGKVVLVTGSTTGIGEACAQVFAESGAKVVVSGRHEPRGRAVVDASRAAYCASKGAVIQITRCMALDHARDNICVNDTWPAEIHTRMVDDILAKRGGDPARNLRELAAGIPLGRLAHPTEVARCVHF